MGFFEIASIERFEALQIGSMPVLLELNIHADPVAA
jgi:hypothetical protein